MFALGNGVGDGDQLGRRETFRVVFSIISPRAMSSMSMTLTGIAVQPSFLQAASRRAPAMSRHPVE